MISNTADETFQIIDISRIQHRGEDWLLLIFPYDIVLIQLIKSIVGRKYTKTHKGWLLPYNVDSLTSLQELNIGFAIKHSDRNDPVYLQLKEENIKRLVYQGSTERINRKIRLLIDTVADKYKVLIGSYIGYLHEQGYSWFGVKCFSHYAISILQGEDNSTHVGYRFDLEESDYKRMAAIFIEFRNRL